MRSRSLGVSIAAVLALSACGGNLDNDKADAGSSFPERAVSLLVGQDAGGSTDLIARALADPASADLKQPITVLNKPGPLTAEEFDHVRTHVRNGVDILTPLRHLGQAVLYVHEHHEHWDGAGYPRGLSGENISLGGRILCAADAFDALTSARSYRSALTPEATIDYLAAHSGALLDPTVFDVLANVVRRGRALVFIDDA